MYAFRAGEAIGVFVFILAIAAVVLFLNRKRKDNPTPYLASGCLGALLAFLGSGEGPTWLAVYTLWYFLLWKYHRESKRAPTRPMRVFYVWIGLAWLLAAFTLCYSSDQGVAVGISFIGLASIVILCAIRWVLLAGPKSKLDRGTNS